MPIDERAYQELEKMSIAAAANRQPYESHYNGFKKLIGYIEFGNMYLRKDQLFCYYIHLAKYEQKRGNCKEACDFADTKDSFIRKMKADYIRVGYIYGKGVTKAGHTTKEETIFHKEIPFKNKASDLFTKPDMETNLRTWNKIRKTCKCKSMDGD